MPACPFSTDRLREMYWRESWRLEQIATLASAYGEIATADDVRLWYEEAGISLVPAEIVVPVSSPARNRRTGGTERPKSKRGPAPGPTAEVPCSWCGKMIERAAWRVEGNRRAFCDQRCKDQFHNRQPVELEKRRSIANAPEAAIAAGIAPAEKACNTCHLIKPLLEFSKDVSRCDGRNQICMDCNRAKSRAYYLANQERQKERSRENKRKAAAMSHADADAS